jgi:uncharacterized protein YjgD (DUF1641 family)
MDPAVVELNHKIDVLTAHVTYLSEQAQLAERQRQDRAELMRDLTPVAEEAFRLSVEQLEEIQDYIDLNDLLRLIKRVLRNGRNLDKLLDQLESLSDLLATVGPLADEAFAKAVDILAEMERKGYFALARGGMRSVDRLVSSLTEEDVRRLGEGGEALFGAIKEVAEPEAMRILGNILLASGREIAKPVDGSYVGLLRQLANPEVRRGLGLMLRMLQAVGGQVPSDGREAIRTQRTKG